MTNLKHKLELTFFLFLTLLIQANAQITPKEQAVLDFRTYFSKHAYRGHQLTKAKVEKITPEKCLKLLGDDGVFNDLREIQKKIKKEKIYLVKKQSSQQIVGEFLEKPFNRMWRIAKTYRGKSYASYRNDPNFHKLLKAINNYSSLEAARGSISTGRFHISCFAIPTAAVNTYFCLFDAMNHIEDKKDNNPMAVEANIYLKQMSFQSWTQPFRNDATDANPVSIQRFQKHVWWVGGNGLGYRSLLPTAAAMGSVEMMDILSIVAKGGLSSVSQNTYDTSFWTEGFTADGSGWGHGMQSLIWGYPISGGSAALDLINYFKGTPWAKELDAENSEALINYFRGSSWHYFNGYTPPCLGRGSMSFSIGQRQDIKTKNMIKSVTKDWLSSYSKSEQKELLDLKEDIKDSKIQMQTYPDGYYNGTRWFFNNDNLIKKNQNYYIFVSMASKRCDGIEMAHTMADRYNFFTCDGMTLFMKEGNEYHKAKGAWNFKALPGVTSRQGKEKLIPITNWRGYCSKYNFAAAATSGGKNAACGFIFEKMNASDKTNVNDTTGRVDPNKSIYGVKANKAFFMVDDYMVALGAGITNLNPETKGNIWTTIDQTHYLKNLQFYSKGKKSKSKSYISEQLDGNDLVWASQEGGFSYAILPHETTGTIHLSTENRKTNWLDINLTNKREKNLSDKEAIFQLHIDHGQKVTNGNYAYVVYSGTKNAKKAFANMPIKIIENTIDVQAMSWGDNYIGASFYNPNKTLHSKKGDLKVSAPCVILIEKKNENYFLSVTDAQMNKDLNFIEIKTTLPIATNKSRKEGKCTIISVPMPQGKLCGKPVTIELKIQQNKNQLL